MAATSKLQPSPEPVTSGSLAPAYASSLVVALLLSPASAIGLLFRSVIYPTEELAQSFVVTDLVNLVIGGVLLWRRRALGYMGGTGLLFQGSMLFIGLIVWMVLAPQMTGAPFVLIDLVVVCVMSVICIVPFALFLRGVT